MKHIKKFNEKYSDGESRASKYIKTVKGIDIMKDAILRQDPERYSDISKAIRSVKDSVKEAIYALPKRKDLTPEYENLSFRLLDIINIHKTAKELVIELDHITRKFKSMNEPQLEKGIKILENALNSYLDILEKK